MLFQPSAWLARKAGSFQGEILVQGRGGGREGNSFCVELYGSVEGWYLSRKETGLEGKKKAEKETILAQL